MNNVINMKGEKGTPVPDSNFRIALKKPLTFCLSPMQMPTVKAEQPKKPSIFKKFHWRFYNVKKFSWEKIIRPTRDFFYRIESNRALGDLAALSLKLNRDDFHVSIDLSGHVNRIIIAAHQGGWVADDKGRRTRVIEGYLPGRYKYGTMRPRDLREAMKLLKSLSKLNHLYPKGKCQYK